MVRGGSLLAAIDQVIAEVDWTPTAERVIRGVHQLGRSLPAGSIGPRMQPVGSAGPAPTAPARRPRPYRAPRGQLQVSSDETTVLMPAVPTEPGKQ